MFYRHYFGYNNSKVETASAQFSLPETKDKIIVQPKIILTIRILMNKLSFRKSWARVDAEVHGVCVNSNQCCVKEGTLDCSYRRFVGETMQTRTHPMMPRLSVMKDLFIQIPDC